jgi:RNA ligase (TIGR02306 family)
MLSKQRVKVVKLRGITSCGLIMPNDGGWEEGTDLTEHFGVVKYQQPIPLSLRGQNLSEPELFHHYTNIQNFNNYSKVLEPGEEVVMTEKIHGTNWRAALIDGKFYVGSHHNCKTYSESVIYWRAAIKNDIEKKMREKLPSGVWILFGEVFGPVQDLKYGSSEIQLRLFDISFNNTYVNYDVFNSFCQDMDLPTAPLIYRGPFDQELLAAMSQGQAFQGDHMREGVVVRPTQERWNNYIGRVILKKINPAYLQRRKGTEYQ